MKDFAQLFRELDETTRTNEKVDALARYFAAAEPADGAWAVHFLIGRRPKRLVSARKLADWAMEVAEVPDWLFAECYEAVGDLAETIALLVPNADRGALDLPLHLWVEELLALRGADEPTQKDAMRLAWRALSTTEVYVWNKLITGGFRVGVAQNLVVRALSRVAAVDEAAIAHRLMGAWEPTPETFLRLIETDVRDTDLSRPYPFMLAHPLEGSAADLGPLPDWQVEWKWDGIRAQLIRRGGCTFIWSRGEELVTDRFPELAQAGALLPEGIALDGEILPWRNGKPQSFAQLQRRIGRKSLGPKLLSEVPVAFLTYDLLELQGADLRDRPLSARRAALERSHQAAPAALKERILLSPIVRAETWQDVEEAYNTSRETLAEGLMLKRLDSLYRGGRRRGDWWKKKLSPYTVDAVMIYAQRGHGKRASLYTDYTFAVWRHDELVPFAKAYTGLTDAEIREVDAWVRRNALQRFGPVRTVRPELVFELAFEGIQRSSRHRSGIAVRFPRILRWRRDKRPEQADRLESILAILDAQPHASRSPAAEK